MNKNDLLAGLSFESRLSLVTGDASAGIRLLAPDSNRVAVRVVAMTGNATASTTGPFYYTRQGADRIYLGRSANLIPFMELRLDLHGPVVMGELWAAHPDATVQLFSIIETLTSRPIELTP